MFEQSKLRSLIGDNLEEEMIFSDKGKHESTCSGLGAWQLYDFGHCLLYSSVSCGFHVTKSHLIFGTFHDTLVLDSVLWRAYKCCIIIAELRCFVHSLMFLTGSMNVLILGQNDVISGEALAAQVSSGDIVNKMETKTNPVVTSFYLDRFRSPAS